MTRPRESFFGSLISSALWRGLERVAALLKHFMIVVMIGLSGQLDAFYMGIGILTLLVFSWSDVADVVGVPRMAALSSENRKAELNVITSGLFSLSVFWSICLTIVWLLALPLLPRLAPGFSPSQQDQLRMALFWFTPVVLLYLPFRQLGGLFRATRGFSVFYRAELLASVGVLFCVVIFRSAPSVLFWSYPVGVLAGFLFLLFHAGRSFSLWTNPFRKQVWALAAMGPALLLLSVINGGYVLIDRMFVSYLPVGSTGALAYGLIFTTISVSLLRPGGSFVTVFSEVRHNEIRARAIFNDLLMLTVVIGAPCTVALITFARPLAELVFSTGGPHVGQVHLLALAIQGMAASAIPLLLLNPMDQVFFVHNRLRSLILRTFAGLIINAALSALVIFVFKGSVLGVGIAASTSYWLMVLMALAYLPRLGLKVEWGPVSIQLIKTLAISTVVAAAGHWALSRLEGVFWVFPALGAYFLLSAIGVWIGGGRGAALAKVALSRLGRA